MLRGTQACTTTHEHHPASYRDTCRPICILHRCDTHRQVVKVGGWDLWPQGHINIESYQSSIMLKIIIKRIILLLFCGSSHFPEVVLCWFTSTPLVVSLFSWIPVSSSCLCHVVPLQTGPHGLCSQHFFFTCNSLEILQLLCFYLFLKIILRDTDIKSLRKISLYKIIL